MVRSIAPVRAALLLLAGAAAPLLVAFGAQHLGGLAPCELCIWQRWAYGGVIAAALLALLAARSPKVAALLLVLGGGAALAGGGIAIFHAGVEQHWWQGLAGCSGAGLSGDMTAEEFEAAILAAPAVRCDEIAWSFAGISMAGYNVLYAAALAIFAFLLAGRIGGRPAA